MTPNITGTRSQRTTTSLTPIFATNINLSTKPLSEGSQTTESLISTANVQYLSTKNALVVSSRAVNINSLPLQRFIRSTLKTTKPMPASTPLYGNNFSITITTGLSISKYISISTLTAATPMSDVTRSYGFDAYNKAVSALTSVLGTPYSPLYHTAVTSAIIPTILNNHDAELGTLDINISHNTTNSFSPGVITGPGL